MWFFPRAWNTIAPHRLFLVDGLGAVLSAVGLGLVLPALEPAVGVPARVLHLLAVLASGLAAYSLRCYWRPPATWPPWLKGIAWANLLYGGLTVALLLGRAPNLTAWGGAYFGLELTVVVLLACWELRMAARLGRSRN
ncbi:hypothetical protein GCM10022409_17390 [Hymenobacter glaciei]|uniref:Uncharacterized protein n=1 Tax=Hymenobacter glaciei TaxID=877209 RepID=A0ABP7TZE2_9BACT